MLEKYSKNTYFHLNNASETISGLQNEAINLLLALANSTPSV